MTSRGCDPRHGFRRSGWSPLGVTPLQVARFQRGQGYHILPAYDWNGIVLSRAFQGTTNANVFEEFIEHLLPFCGKWPEDRSVLVMDNTSLCQRPLQTQEKGVYNSGDRLEISVVVPNRDTTLQEKNERSTRGACSFCAISSPEILALGTLQSRVFVTSTSPYIGALTNCQSFGGH